MSNTPENDTFTHFDRLKYAPGEVASMQRFMGSMWAAKYADETEEPSRDAEVILRNPNFCLRHIDLNTLPDELGGRWEKLLDDTEELVPPREDGMMDTFRNNPLERLQYAIGDGRLDPSKRDEVAEILALSSELFADSIEYIPDHTEYYAEKVIQAGNLWK